MILREERFATKEFLKKEVARISKKRLINQKLQEKEWPPISDWFLDKPPIPDIVFDKHAQHYFQIEDSLDSPPTEGGSLVYDSEVEINMLVLLKPFRPYFKYILLTERKPFLLPIYLCYVPEQLFPDMDEAAMGKEMLNDVAGIYELKVSLDRKPIRGFAVMRQKKLKVDDIKENNLLRIPIDRLSKGMINVTYVGLFTFFEVEQLTKDVRDHYVSVNVKSLNYQINAELLVTAAFPLPG
jgi:hypothetical protein